jgi:hypothetical protein
MKKLYFALGAALIAFSVQGQRLQDIHEFAMTPHVATEAEMMANVKDYASALEVAQRGGGTVLFYEDFLNGFDGNNGLGAWTAEDTGEGMIWQWVDPAGDGFYADGAASDVQPPAGEFSSSIGSLNSTTSGNGWMVFDCDYFNTPISEGYENTEGYIESPAMDFSANTSVVVSWEQYFRYCCYPYAPVFLQVSNDGGASFTTFDAHGSFIESANVASANGFVASVDISCAAAGQSDVLIRFSYLQPDEVGDGYSHYYWGIDDVTITENPTENDLSVVQLATGDIWNLYEYRMIPMEQRIFAADGGLTAGVLYRNDGYANQDESIVTIEIMNEAGEVLSTTVEELGILNSFANAENCPANAQDTTYIATGWEPDAMGTYIVQATIGSANEDATPDNNVISKEIIYTDYEYGHDDAGNFDLELVPGDSEIDGLFNPCGYGNFYHIQNEGSTAYGLLVAFGPSAGLGDLDFESRLYTYDPANGLTDSPFELAEWNDADIENSANAGNPTFTWLPFDDAIDLEQGLFYFGGVITEFEGEFQLTVLGNSNSDTDNSTGDYGLTGAGDFVWFTSQTHTPAVRLVTSDYLGIDVAAATEGLHLYQNTPNPAEGTTTIRFELLRDRSVSLEVRDMQGRLVTRLDRGQLGAGKHGVTIDVSGYAQGMYTYSLVADGLRFTKKMTIR